MKFSNLHVVHLYDYQKPEQGKCPVDLFIKSINPMALSTCMRHIYIFTSAQLEGKDQAFDKAITQIQTPQPYKKLAFCEYLQGEQAYRFLLFWSIGGLNKNKLFADERILGDLRKGYLNYEKSNSPKKQTAWEENKWVMLDLLTDSKNLLPLTKKTQTYAIDEQANQLKYACENCTWARVNQLMKVCCSLDYELFLDKKLMLDRLLELLTSKLSLIYEELRKLSNDDSKFGFFFSEDPKKLGLEESARIAESLIQVVHAEIESESVSAMQIN